MRENWDVPWQSRKIFVSFSGAIYSSSNNWSFVEIYRSGILAFTSKSCNQNVTSCTKKITLKHNFYCPRVDNVSHIIFFHILRFSVFMKCHVNALDHKAYIRSV